MKPPREIDVIDVNINWSVWVGTLSHGYRIGTVKAHDRLAARVAAREAFPGTRIGFVSEERW